MMRRLRRWLRRTRKVFGRGAGPRETWGPLLLVGAALGFDETVFLYLELRV